MTPSRIATALALLAAASARAQLPEPASPPALEALTPPKAPFADSFKPFPRAYGGDENASPNARHFPAFGTDPKLVGGYEIVPNFAIEAGYLSLRDRGFHKLDDDPKDVPGALATRSFSTYLAGKITVPVTERLSGFAKAGVAYSERKRDVAPGRMMGNTDVGPYLGVGAQYKMDKQSTVSGEIGRVGNTSGWQGANAGGVKAKLKLGF